MTTKTRTTVPKIAVLALAFMNLVGCNVVQTTQMVPGTGIGQSECASDGIAYFMPDRLLKVQVISKPAESPKVFTLEFTGNDDFVADRREQFCLEIQNNIFSKDEIGAHVVNGLLQRVFTTSEDQSGTVIDTFIEGAANIEAGNQANDVLSQFNLTPASAQGTKIEFGPHPFNPFDQTEMADLNRRLADFGHCVYMDPYNDAYVASWGPQQCGQPLPPSRVGKLASSEVLEATPTSVPEPWGVVYRPLLPHRFVVTKRPDPNRHTKFQRVASYAVQMPNAAPNFSIAVKRAAFTTRQTTLVLDDGVLKDVMINKEGSEAVGLFSIPISIAQAIVSIPAEIVRIQITNTGNQRQLLIAQQGLIQANTNLITAQAALATAQEANQNNSGEVGPTSTNLQFNLDASAAAELCREVAAPYGGERGLSSVAFNACDAALKTATDCTALSDRDQTIQCLRSTIESENAALQ